MVGTLVFAIFETLAVLAGSGDDTWTLAGRSLVHFLVPFVIAYTIVTNNPSSRVLILVYLIGMTVLALNGWQYSRLAVMPGSVEFIVLTLVGVASFQWLYRSRKMRYYYASITGRPIPEDLQDYGVSLAGDKWLSKKGRRRLYWAVGHIETIVIVGFIIVVFIAFAATA